MGLTKDGSVIYRDEYSKCQSCEWYLGNNIDKYKCWSHNYIPVYMWNGYDDPKESNCPYFKSTISDQCNSCYVHKDYESMKDPERKFGGTYRFDKNGNIIGMR